MLRTPEAVFEAGDGHYRLPLAVGPYLLCIDAYDRCFDVTVQSGGMSTFNIKLTVGESFGYFAPPGATELSPVEETRL
jgi:hypothetical protein